MGIEGQSGEGHYVQTSYCTQTGQDWCILLLFMNTGYQPSPWILYSLNQSYWCAVDTTKESLAVIELIPGKACLLTYVLMWPILWICTLHYLPVCAWSGRYQDVNSSSLMTDYDKAKFLISTWVSSFNTSLDDFKWKNFQCILRHGAIFTTFAC